MCGLRVDVREDVEELDVGVLYEYYVGGWAWAVGSESPCFPHRI